MIYFVVEIIFGTSLTLLILMVGWMVIEYIKEGSKKNDDQEC